MNIFKGKKIIVFGGTGSIGSEIVKLLLSHNPKQIRVFARDETKHQELLTSLHFSPILRSLIGDVRDRERVRFAVKDVDIIFNAAALKAVPYCEYNPMEAVYTNVYGTQNIIQAALDENVERMVTISTDKASEPINILGATKLLSERLTSAADFYRGYSQTVFTSVRFGNVLGSRNSILPIIKQQILNHKPVTITDPKMTRFIMSVPEAVKLTFRALTLAKGGEMFILKMPAVYIADLVDAYTEIVCKENNLDKKLVRNKYINPRPGEKYDEKLISDYEASSCYENNELFVVVSNIDKPNQTTLLKKYRGFRKLKDLSSFDSSRIKKLSKSEVKEVLKRAQLK